MLKFSHGDCFETVKLYLSLAGLKNDQTDSPKRNLRKEDYNIEQDLKGDSCRVYLASVHNWSDDVEDVRSGQ